MLNLKSPNSAFRYPLLALLTITQSVIGDQAASTKSQIPFVTSSNDPAKLSVQERREMRRDRRRRVIRALRSEGIDVTAWIEARNELQLFRRGGGGGEGEGEGEGECVPGCTMDLPNDGCCDPVCNNRLCDYDGGDCETCPPFGCEPCAFCGDGACNGGETCATCFGDCQAQCPPGNTIYVNGAHAGCENGSIVCPFNTVSEGNNAAADGNTIIISGADYRESITFTKRLTVSGTAGLVRIGPGI